MPVSHFIGSYVLGMGFTFDDTDKDGVANPLTLDDTDKDGVANPLTLMNEMIAKDPRNAERIFPYIGGEEVNDIPTHAHHRYVINFGEMKEMEARKWPDLMRIVEEKVKPERDKLGNNSSAKPRKAKWWLWGRYTPGLFSAMSGMTRVLVLSRVGQHGLFAFAPSTVIFSERNRSRPSVVSGWSV